MVPEAAAGKNTPERRLCATARSSSNRHAIREQKPRLLLATATRQSARSLEAPQATSSPWTYTIGPKAVRPACAVADPNPCIGKSELNCPACPVRPR